ncbi:hypothetical protein PQX77_009489 [Marasmius sp. AFHP31]|nr:hypothetical protein PQX77_009489 [Marasmius sp. AFHP31]
MLEAVSITKEELHSMYLFIRIVELRRFIPVFRMSLSSSLYRQKVLRPSREGSLVQKSHPVEGDQLESSKDATNGLTAIGSQQRSKGTLRISRLKGRTRWTQDGNDLPVYTFPEGDRKLNVQPGIPAGHDAEERLPISTYHQIF